MLVITFTIFASSTCYWALSLTILLRTLRDVLINHLDLSFADKFAFTNGRVSRLYLGEVYLAMINVRPAFPSYPSRSVLTYLSMIYPSTR